MPQFKRTKRSNVDAQRETIEPIRTAEQFLSAFEAARNTPSGQAIVARRASALIARWARAMHRSVTETEAIELQREYESRCKAALKDQNKERRAENKIRRENGQAALRLHRIPNGVRMNPDAPIIVNRADLASTTLAHLRESGADLRSVPSGIRRMARTMIEHRTMGRDLWYAYRAWERRALYVSRQATLAINPDLPERRARYHADAAKGDPKYAHRFTASEAARIANGAYTFPAEASGIGIDHLPAMIAACREAARWDRVSRAIVGAYGYGLTIEDLDAPAKPRNGYRAMCARCQEPTDLSDARIMRDGGRVRLCAACVPDAQAIRASCRTRLTIWDAFCKASLSARLAIVGGHAVNIGQSLTASEAAAIILSDSVEYPFYVSLASGTLPTLRDDDQARTLLASAWRGA